MSWTMRRQFWFVEINFVKNRHRILFFPFLAFVTFLYIIPLPSPLLYLLAAEEKNHVSIWSLLDATRSLLLFSSCSTFYFLNCKLEVYILLLNGSQAMSFVPIRVMWGGSYWYYDQQWQIRGQARQVIITILKSTAWWSSSMILGLDIWVYNFQEVLGSIPS